MTTANVVLSPVVVVLSPAVKWQWQWRESAYPLVVSQAVRLLVVFIGKRRKTPCVHAGDIRRDIMVTRCDHNIP